MEELKLLKTGTKLQLIIYNEFGERVQPTFTSVFEWAEDDKNLYIAAPIHEGVLFPVHIGAIIELFYVVKIDEFLKIDMYRLRTIVTDRSNEEQVALLKVKVLSDPERIQRRRFYRMKTVLPVDFREPLPVNMKPAKPVAFKSALTRDLSGGGMCVAVQEPMEYGKALEFILYLNDDIKIVFTGKIVRVTKLFENGIYIYLLGVAFHKIDDKDREEIVRYIFFEQRKLRKKGLI